MKLTDIIKNEKLLCFAGGVLAATYGVKALKSEKARKTNSFQPQFQTAHNQLHLLLDIFHLRK